MRIMLDTNVLISALLFPGDKMDRMIYHIFTRHKLVLSSYVIDELKSVVKRKFPQKKLVVEELLGKIEFEHALVPEEVDRSLFSIRDVKDYPVLYSAIKEDVDIFITGDKDFLEVSIIRPKIMTPREFCDKFVK